MSKQKKVRVVHDTDIGTAQQGVTFLSCAKCLDEKPEDISAKDYARQQVSLTPMGIQVWCNRHDVNIDHMKMEVK